MKLLLFCLVALCKASSLVDSYEKATEESLLWGAYRPNAFMGIRPRLPHSLISGLFWFNADEVENISKFRHYCDQNLDFQGFGWESYDPRIGGTQFFKDNELNINITTDFIKNDDGNWALKIRGKPKAGFENQTMSIVFYTGLEGEGSLVSGSGKPANGFKPGETINLIGNSPDLNDFIIQINDGPASNQHKKIKKKELLDPSINPAKTHYMSLRVTDDNVWQASEIFKILLQDSITELSQKFMDNEIVPPNAALLTLRNSNGFEGNLHFVQKLFVGEFEFDIIFNKESSKDQYSSKNLQAKINESLTEIDNKFNKVFLLQHPFNKPEYKKFCKEVFANLLGGIGYYHGKQLVDRETELNEETFQKIQLIGKEEGPYDLFTASPSRTFFPRGFYWDEGFHLLPIIDYDSDLVLEILKSWFNLIDEDGWIAREQILGPEARSKVPEEFQTQSPHIANPPTLMLSFVDLLKKAKSNSLEFGDLDEPELILDYSSNEFDFTKMTDAHLKYPELLIDYAKDIYPKLQSHYEWFRKTQKGELDEFDRDPHSPVEAYRWKGRTVHHCLPSGLDDYPRAENPDIAELNVDLISWIGLMTRSMKEIAELLDKTEDSLRYGKIEKDIQKNIEDLHWSKEDKAYCDVSVDKNDENIFVCHKGYISLFPFLLQILEPDNEHLKDIIDLITDRDHLWTNYGIRSLSVQDQYYRTGEDYWRSPVWYPINYLVLKALQFYGSGENGQLLDDSTYMKASEAYRQLRINLVENCYNNWVRTGFLFEQYNDLSGQGQKAKHFTGWTGLVSLIMKMPESL